MLLVAVEEVYDGGILCVAILSLSFLVTTGLMAALLELSCVGVLEKYGVKSEEGKKPQNEKAKKDSNRIEDRQTGRHTE